MRESNKIPTQDDVAISSGNFGILKNKRSNVEFAFKGDLRSLIQWSHFHKKPSAPSSLRVTQFDNGLD